MPKNVEEMLRNIFGNKYVGLRKIRRQNCIGVCVTYMYRADLEELEKYHYKIEKFQGSSESTIIIAIKKIK